MTNPATPLNNQAAIAQLSTTIDALVIQFVRPTAQQTSANTQAIDALITGPIAALVESSRVANARSIENSQRFESWLADARADRQRSDERFNAQLTENKAQMAEIRALGEQSRALLSALATTNGRVDTLEQAG